MSSRVEKSFKNSLYGIIGLFLNALVAFIARSVFIKLLGSAYNGLNGLFTNILQVLNLAELGFASSVAYALYKPLKDGDERNTAMIMSYFAKIYRIIALIVAVAGCCCVPFLQYLIAEDISTLPFSLLELRLYFCMYLANTVCSYILAYKRTIITADQSAYIISIADNTGNIVLNLLQIALLLITQNYFAFLGIMIAKTIVNNLVIHLIAGKRYPYLKKYKEKLPKEERQLILKNVQALLFHKIGTVVIYSTSTIIMSTFVSLIAAGKYANYLMIVTQVNAFINIFFNAILASIGNLCVNEDKEYEYIVFKRILYISNFFTVFVFSCYVCLFNDFITLWVGEEMLLDFPTMIAISFTGIVSYVRIAVNTFKDANGLWRKDWYKSLLEAAVGIGLAIGLSFVWGTFGVVIGYSIASLFIAMPIENIVLYKYGFERPLGKRFLQILGIILFSFAVTAVMYIISSFIPLGIGWFILKLLFCVIFVTAIYVLITFRTSEFQYYRQLLLKILKKLKNKEKKKVSEVPSKTQENTVSLGKDCETDRTNNSEDEN